MGAIILYTRYVQKVYVLYIPIIINVTMTTTTGDTTTTKNEQTKILMDEEKFLEFQYFTLRKEIEATKDRIFKIIIGGATVVPAAQFFAEVYKVGVITLVLPFLVIIIMLLFLHENNALMRCGRFIKFHIEPHVPSLTCWEDWLSKPTPNFDTRASEKYLIYSFYLLSTLYYIASVYLAAVFSNTEYEIVGLAITLGTYSAVGILTVVLLFTKVKTGTVVKGETVPKINKPPHE